MSFVSQVIVRENAGRFALRRDTFSRTHFGIHCDYDFSLEHSGTGLGRENECGMLLWTKPTLQTTCTYHHPTRPGSL